MVDWLWFAVFAVFAVLLAVLNWRAFIPLAALLVLVLLLWCVYRLGGYLVYSQDAAAQLHSVRQWEACVSARFIGEKDNGSLRHKGAEADGLQDADC